MWDTDVIRSIYQSRDFGLFGTEIRQSWDSGIDPGIYTLVFQIGLYFCWRNGYWFV